MERVELLRARIALYRRYLREGADGDIATAYLWLIRKDEIELTALVESFRREPEAGQKNPEVQPEAYSHTPKSRTC
jgi:hypothetical protein